MPSKKGKASSINIGLNIGDKNVSEYDQGNFVLKKVQLLQN